MTEEQEELRTFTVSARVKVDAATPEDAGRLAMEMWSRGDADELWTASQNDIADALKFYADPDSYFAIFVTPDRPAGEFADDIGCVIGPHGDHDHRHGRTARRALGREWWGTEPCDEMRKLMKDEGDEKEEGDKGE